MNFNSHITVARGGFTFSKYSVGGAWTWEVSADNIQGANQLYYVRDIRTPFGALTDGVDVPIPGDVVTQMAATLVQLQQQMAPQLTLVAGQPTSFNVTITQGDPSSDAGIVNFL